MRPRAKRIAGWLAIFAIALHTALWGIGPLAADAADPISVICHSGTAAAPPADDSTGAPNSAVGHGCDHCNLCSAAPPATVGEVLAGYLAPAALLLILRPADALAGTLFTAAPKLARGPPQRA